MTQDSLICSKYATFQHLPSKLISSGHTFKPDFLFLLLCNLLYLLYDVQVYCVFTAQYMKILPCYRKAKEQYGHWSTDFTSQRIIWEFQHAVQSQHFNYEFSSFALRKYSRILEAYPWQQSTNSERVAGRRCFLRDNMPDVTRWSDPTTIDTFLYLHWLKHTLSFPWINWHLTNFSCLWSKCVNT